MPLGALRQLTLVKLRELYREPEAMFWVFAFPVIMSLALGIAFRSQDVEKIPVGVVERAGASGIIEALEEDPQIRPVLLAEEAADAQLARGKLSLVVVPGTPWTYWYDTDRPEGRLAELVVDRVLQAAAGPLPVQETERRKVTRRGARYIDFVVPGLLGMSLMGTGLWGIGFYIVNARSGRLLKRLVASPMRRIEYLISQFTGRLVFLVLEVIVLVGFARLLFDVPLRGSIVALGVVCLTGALAFSGIGLLVAARPRTIEGVSGLMNVVMLPMWVCSGTFFSAERFPDAVQPAVQALPLTALNDALRAVMLEGAGYAQIGGELVLMVAWGVASLFLALATFRWT